MNRLFCTLLASLFSLPLFAQQSFDITFNHTGKIVHGTFSTPSGSGPFPTIIINPGSGANDREGTLPMAGGNANCLYPGLLNDTLRPYKGLANALVDSGYAVLSYDKLEYTYGANLGTISFEKLWLPVESAIEHVKTRSDVDTSRIVLIGHSEGSSLIPYIAKNRSDIAALISLAGPRTPFDSILANQIVYITKTCGGDTSMAQAQANQILSYFNTIRTNTWNNNTPSLFGVPASVWYDYIRVIDSVSINYNLAKRPTLFVGLEEDINVPPAELIKFQNEITVTNDFYSIEGLNHYMTSNTSPHVSEVLTDTIIDWLRQNIVPTGINEFQKGNISVTASPNPFHDYISIQIQEKNIGDINISLLTINGKIIEEKLTTDNKGHIDMNNFPSGVYIIKIDAKNGSTSLKVIKQ